MLILRDRLALARKYVSVLKRLRSGIGGSRDLEADLILRGAVERYLHLSVEALIDVGMRLCSMLRLGKPERYRDVAKLLGESGVLSSGEAKEFELWIGLRNVLVHGYASIDCRKLVEALQEVEKLESIIDSLEKFVYERNLDPFEPLSELVNRVKEVLAKRDYVLFAYLFGSRIRGLPVVKGDVDVAVYTDRAIGWREFIEVMNELEDSLGTRVDLIHLNTAPLPLAYEIVTTGIVVIDRDPSRRVDFEVKVVKEYLDLKLELEKKDAHRSVT